MRSVSIVVSAVLAMTAAASAVARAGPNFECVRVCLTQTGNEHRQCPFSQATTACVCDKPGVIEYAVDCVHRQCAKDLDIARDWFKKVCPNTQIPGL
ncbi:hypothetical protein BOTBODRAFT_176261 [Botryobasidium botryosum FD-172 SS1]|uniref:CFEM domain-containing protein n=1 Tax=Botryobasidium botryosum (strain FD-172 SS1) TaxID=930990 RepID=A0A067MLV3_BOTB1|nr:hypothetical protein BOTBODRAFT_176261 [Botryobasidium botryosum FD-172 SS1]